MFSSVGSEHHPVSRLNRQNHDGKYLVPSDDSDMQMCLGWDFLQYVQKNPTPPGRGNYLRVTHKMVGYYNGKRALQKAIIAEIKWTLKKDLMFFVFSNDCRYNQEVQGDQKVSVHLTITVQKTRIITKKYRVIKKSLCTWRLQYKKTRIITKKYRVIKKSLCTWRLQYKKNTHYNQEVQGDQIVSVLLTITVQKKNTQKYSILNIFNHLPS